MTAQFWWIWIVLAAVFIIGELFTAGFFLLWFGVGAGVAGVLCKVGVDSVWQWAAFAGTSLVLFFASRPLANKLSREQPPGIGADRFVHHDGIVIETIDKVKNTGMVRVGTEEWRAESGGMSSIAVDTVVTVAAISGNHLIVKPKEGD